MKNSLTTLRAVIFFCLFLLNGTLIAQVRFDQTIGQGLYLGDAIKSASGNYYVATGDRLTCFTPAGTVIWSKQFQQPGLGIARVIETGSDVVLAGSLSASPYGGFFLMKLDAMQNVLWMHVYHYSSGTYPMVKDACMSSNNEFVIAGQASPFSYLLKTDASGELIWTRTFPYSSSLTVAESSNQTLLLGMSSSTILNIDTAGTILWQHAYFPQGGSGAVTGIAATNGGYIFTGNCSQAGNSGFMIVRSDTSGVMIAGSTFIDTVGQWAFLTERGTALPDSGIFVPLFHYEAISGGQSSGAVAYVDSAAVLRWTRKYTTLWSSITAFADTGVVILGCSELNTTQYGFLKTDPAGVAICPGSVITLVHGPSLTDSTFGIQLAPAIITDSIVTIPAPFVSDSVTLLNNCAMMSVLQYESMDFSLYPNPNSGNEFVIDGVLQPAEIRIINQLGQTVHVQRVNTSPEKIIPASELSPGVYVVEVIGPGATVRKQLVVH